MLSLVLLTALAGGNVISPGELELYPTPRAIGLELPFTGDDNQNAKAEFVWRRSGEKDWHKGVDLTIDRKHRLMWASIWPLNPGETVEVRLTLSDPEAKPFAPIEKSVTTRLVMVQAKNGRELFVSPNGEDANPGTKEKPFLTLTRAAKAVRAGDVVTVASGTYREGDLFQRLKGTSSQPILFRAAPNAKPVIDSSLTIATNSGKWKKVERDVYVTNVEMKSTPGYVSQNGLRSFRMRSLAELKNAKMRTNRTWFYDAKAKQLYVRTGNGKSPDDHEYRVSQHDYGILLTRSQFVTIQGFTIQNYGNCAVRISEGARGCVVINNLIQNVPCGIFMKTETTQDTTIWKNEIREPGLADFPWGAIKGSDYPRQGVFFVAGRGTSVCYNRIHGWFDCVCPESWKRPDQLMLNRDCDVMDNELYNAGDDAIEADGGGVNMRLHSNHIRNCLAALSLAPVERGPLYCTRNDATFIGLMFKLNVSGCTSLGWAYCYHNSGYCLTIGADGGTGISFAPKIPCTNKVFLNNAILCNEYSVRAGRDGCRLDHNCYFPVPGKPVRKFQWERKTYRTLAQFAKATGQEQHGIYQDPKFRSTPGLGKRPNGDWLADPLSRHPLVRGVDVGDLRLEKGSSCIDRGAVIRGINENHHGKAPDIGAFETDAK